MSRINFGRKYHVGPFCGERFLSFRSWKRYPFIKIYTTGGFSIGPILFWKEYI